MSRYIDADALIELQKIAKNAVLEKYAVNNSIVDGYDSEFVKAINYTIRVLRLCHAADVRENVRGEWRVNNNLVNVCSVCGNGSAASYYFCPNCGADMRGKEWYKK